MNRLFIEENTFTLYLINWLIYYLILICSCRRSCWSACSFCSPVNWISLSSRILRTKNNSSCNYLAVKNNFGEFSSFLLDIDIHTSNHNLFYSINFWLLECSFSSQLENQGSAEWLFTNQHISLTLQLALWTIITSFFQYFHW